MDTAVSEHQETSSNMAAENWTKSAIPRFASSCASVPSANPPGGTFSCSPFICDSGIAVMLLRLPLGSKSTFTASPGLARTSDLHRSFTRGYCLPSTINRPGPVYGSRRTLPLFAMGRFLPRRGGEYPARLAHLLSPRIAQELNKNRH